MRAECTAVAEAKMAYGESPASPSIFLYKRAGAVGSGITPRTPSANSDRVMISYLALLVVPFLASLAVASPTARQTYDCSQNNFGKFMMLAVSESTGLNGVQVVLSSNGNSALDLATIDSSTITVASIFTMSGGGIFAYDEDSNEVGVSNEVGFNDVLSFYSSGGPAEVYSGCIPPNTNNEIIFTLAVNGEDDQLSLCESYNLNGERVLVYHATTGSPDYDGTICETVKVNVEVQLD